MDLILSGTDGAPSSERVQVADEVFGLPFNAPLVHQVVTAYLAGGRAGTRAQKSRAQVRGGGSKPWRQKGTGRARSGTIRSPLWQGGGVTFAAQPQDHAQKVNRKMYRGALRSILGELVRQQRLVVVQEMSLEAPKTKELVAKLKGMAAANVLIVIDGEDDTLGLASRNLPNVDVRDAGKVDPVQLVAYEKVMVTVPALKRLEGMLS